jgi:hypothetical protein
MIFEYVENIFEHYPQSLIHPVSCLGLSQDYLTKQIKKSYPDYYRHYKHSCLRKKLQPGRAYFYPLNTLFGLQFIVTLTIKYNWQEKIHADTLKKSLNEFFEVAKHLKLESVGIPDIKETPQNWIRKQFEAEDFNSLEHIIFFKTEDILG